MVFDFLVTLLVVVKLWAWRKQGGLSQMMLEKGISYFIIASCGNLVQAVLAALHLSSLLNVLFLPVAMCISVIGMFPNREFRLFKLTYRLIFQHRRGSSSDSKLMPTPMTPTPTKQTTLTHQGPP